MARRVVRTSKVTTWITIPIDEVERILIEAVGCNVTGARVDFDNCSLDEVTVIWEETTEEGGEE